MGIGTPTQWWSLVIMGLTFTYGIFLLFYLNNTKKFVSHMTDRDKNFRKVAVIVTWIEVILTGLGILALIFNIVSGMKYTGDYPSSPLSDMAKMSYGHEY